MIARTGVPYAPREVADIVGSHALERLQQYVDLLAKWRQITNLISDDSFREIWGRHILDSIFLQKECPNAQIWLDIGSGAGLPGIVLAIVLADMPGAQVHCVEIDRRKCAFLREVVTKLNLPMKVHNAFAGENATGFFIDVVTARAFASLPKILSIVDPYLVAGAIAVLPRGRLGHDEVARLDKALYSIHVRPNPASDDGLFVHIERRELRTP